VICSVRLDRPDRQPGPLRELVREQATNEPDVGLDLAIVHPGARHCTMLP
jgi:hypothetical protein